MKPEKLSDIRRELKSRNPAELAEIALRLAKYKKENKELLNYLLFESENPLAYAQRVMESHEEDFRNLPRYGAASTKSLQKIIRSLNRHAKYTAARDAEIEMHLWFCKRYLEHADLRTSYSPLRNIFLRQLIKIAKLLTKLHEDLQFDYQHEFDDVLKTADETVRWFSRRMIL